ncbi:unnamed protein product [Schistosoma curassoni]|uniref:Uncharacterized protein n=1 Tax=Schistosoma curassoni TaxID=6186 RepID=A0A183JQH1_9TREM|nr:unnamed protein product [Schistosoma curassoni]
MSNLSYSTSSQMKNKIVTVNFNVFDKYEQLVVLSIEFRHTYMYIE